MESDDTSKSLEEMIKFALSEGGHAGKPTSPVEYWKQYFGRELSFRAIITHPDRDHFKGIKEFYDRIGIQNLWIPTDHKDKLSNDNEDEKFINDVISGRINVKFVEPKRGDDREFYGVSNPDWDNIQILHPAKAYEAETCNRGSYLLKIHNGKSSVIIGGDSEPETYEWLLDKYSDELSCTVFVASHHGRQSGWPGKDVMEAMNPLMVVISKGYIDDKDSAVDNYKRVLGNDRVLTTSYTSNLRVQLSQFYDDIDTIECDREYVNELLPERLQNARELRRMHKLLQLSSLVSSIKNW